MFAQHAFSHRLPIVYSSHNSNLTNLYSMKLSKLQLTQIMSCIECYVSTHDLFYISHLIFYKYSSSSSPLGRSSGFSTTCWMGGGDFQTTPQLCKTLALATPPCRACLQHPTDRSRPPFGSEEGGA